MNKKFKDDIKIANFITLMIITTLIIFYFAKWHDYPILNNSDNQQVDVTNN